MSRSGYVDDWDEDNLLMGRWRGMVKSAIRGKRGQAFLREMAAALDALPEKALIESALVTDEGDCCAMGAVCKARGMDVSGVDPEEPEAVAALFDIADCLAQEIAYENDECGPIRWDLRTDPRETPAERWVRMRKWVAKQIGEEWIEPSEAAQ